MTLETTNDADYFNFNREGGINPLSQKKTFTGAVELLKNKYNIIFITLDSLPFKTYQKASNLGLTPNINSLGKVLPAISPASFTLPSHAAYFGGHFPQVTELNDSLGVSRTYRLFNSATSNAQKRKVVTGKLLEGKDIFEGFRKKGHEIQAYAGAIFFEKNKEENIGPLAEYFHKNELKYFPNSVSKNRKHADVPLGNIEEISNNLETLNEKPWFLFINDTATHIPYHFNMDNKLIKQTVKDSEYLFKGSVDSQKNYENTGKILEEAQIKSLKFVDNQLGKLIASIKNKTKRDILFILCGDHGECFGEATFFGTKHQGYFGHCWNGAEENMQVPLLLNIIKKS